MQIADYCREIEAYLCQKNDGHLIRVVGPSFGLVSAWAEQGVPIKVEGFVRAASKNKWLEAHGIEHWTHFYTDYGRQLQLRFFDHFLKGEDNGWDRQPPLILTIRDPRGSVRGSPLP